MSRQSSGSSLIQSGGYQFDSRVSRRSIAVNDEDSFQQFQDARLSLRNSLGATIDEQSVETYRSPLAANPELRRRTLSGEPSVAAADPMAAAETYKTGRLQFTPGVQDI